MITPLFDHPSLPFVEFCRRCRIRLVEFGVYKYNPSTFQDERIIQRVPAESSITAFEQLSVDAARDGREVAIHSRVWLKSVDEPLHVPMIDFFALPDIHAAGDIRGTLQRYGVGNGGAFVFSGRSVHAYAWGLLTHAHWISFMGELLLVNRVDSDPVVDWRWIGHRLMAGYGSLRWTHNTASYKSGPRFVSELDSASEALKRLRTLGIRAVAARMRSVVTDTPFGEQSRRGSVDEVWTSESLF